MMESKPRGTGNPSLGSYLNGLSRSLPRWVLILAAVVPILLVVGIVLLAGRTGEPEPAPSSPTRTRTALPDGATAEPCAVELVRPEVERMDALMVEFYDASALASQTPAEQLIFVIPSLQEIRRRADAIKVSACVEQLKSFQIAHMNMVINTMLAFMNKSDPEMLVEGIIQARLLNEEYRKEKARLLGEEYIPPPTPAYTPTAEGTGTVQPDAAP